MSRFSILLPICLFFVSTILAQTSLDSLSTLRIGDWQQHLPWQRAQYVTQSTEKVWFCTEWSVVEVDKTDRSTKFLSKVEGLSDVGMSLAKYNPETKKLLIAYTNSNLDLYEPSTGAITNLPFIRKNINLTGDKTINHVLNSGNFAYISCGFGLLKMNLNRAEASFTVFTQRDVRGAALFGGFIYIGTDDGLFRIPENDPNPEDFGRWESLGTAQGLPDDADVTAIEVFDTKIWLGIGKSLYRFDGSNSELITTHPDRKVVYMTQEGAGLTIGWRVGFGGNIEYISSGSTFRDEIHWTCDAQRPRFAIEDGNKKFWIADYDDQFRYYDRSTDQCERFKYNSPYTQHSTEISIVRDKVYVATPGAKSDLKPQGVFQTGMYVFESGQWKQFSGFSNPELVPFNCNKDMWRVTGHPTMEKFYVGSFDGGLVEVNDDLTNVKCYTKANSVLQSAGAAGQDRTAIGGMAFDKDNNLWIINYASTAPIAVLKADGNFKNFSGTPANNLIQIAIDQNGYKWFVVGFNGGVLVYDSGADINSPADDRYRILNTANSNLPTNTVSSVAVDLDGDVWVGTQQGVVTFECGTNVFDADCKGRRRIVNVDGFNAYLLETEDVRSIAIDGANRKWFGTTNGVFVQSPDALTQVAQFTSTNSPLFDNNITDIAINQRNGEVWIGTEKGITSLRAEATTGGKAHSLAPYAYPNPVKPDYDGPIAIYGLARDSNIKITDVAGNLVYEGKSLGGQAVWNGRDYQGRRAASGVYLVYATSAVAFDNPDAIITKVVVLN